MKCGAEQILNLTFGKEGNEASHLGAGWSGDEPGYRWMVGAASEVWLEHPGTGHDLILELELDIMTNPGGPVPASLAIGVRGRAIAQITVRRAGVLGFHVPAELVAAPGPVRVQLMHPDFQRPSDSQGGTDDRQLSFSARSLRLYRVLPRPANANRMRPPIEQMMMRFENLGDNCELGLVQRRLGVEPLGLLRFSYIELHQTLRGLRSGFDGLGDPDGITVSTDGPDQEFVVREAAYGITYHTFQYAAQISGETVRAQQAARLQFLRRKLISDVANGEKIFVVRRREPLRPEEVLPLYATLNIQGLNWLLWMVPSGAGHPSGTVELLLPGLLRGYVDRFAPNENAHDLSLTEWTSVCEAAWRIASL